MLIVKAVLPMRPGAPSDSDWTRRGGAALLPTEEWPQGSRYQADDALLWIMALRSTGTQSGAQARLQRLSVIIDQYNLTYLKPQIERLTDLEPHVSA